MKPSISFQIKKTLKTFVVVKFYQKDTNLIILKNFDVTETNGWNVRNQPAQFLLNNIDSINLGDKKDPFN